MLCTKCGAAVAADETFCAACGAVLTSAPLEPQISKYALHDHVGKARKWLLVMALLTLVGSGIVYLFQQHDVEKQIAEAVRLTEGMDPAVVDAAMRAETGMSFQEALDHDRGQVKLMLAINVGLALFYFGMWIWAKRNALGATVTALIAFVTVMGASAVLEPKTLVQGVIIKVIFIVVLVKGIQAAADERRLARAAGQA